jgi:hypothetical protein
MSTTGKVWILYDGRAESGDTDDAQVLEVCGTSKRAVKVSLWSRHGEDAVLVEYDAVPGPNADQLENERIIGHMREGRAVLLKRCKAQPDLKRNTASIGTSYPHDGDGREADHE